MIHNVHASLWNKIVHSVKCNGKIISPFLFIFWIFNSLNVSPIKHFVWTLKTGSTDADSSSFLILLKLLNHIFSILKLIWLLLASQKSFFSNEKLCFESQKCAHHICMTGYGSLWQKDEERKTKCPSTHQWSLCPWSLCSTHFIHIWI